MTWSAGYPCGCPYRLEAGHIVKRTRRNAFRTDPRLLPEESARCADYAGSGYDRGHLVPSGDMNRSAVAQANTYFLSNMSPQYPLLNQGVWSRLEDAVRAWAKASGAVHVISGSVFDRDNDGRPDSLADTIWTKPMKRVGVPSHFYKVLLRQTAGGDFEVLAVMLPNQRQGLRKTDEFIREHLVSVQDIRQRTGLDLFPKMEPSRKERLERAVASDLWPRN